MFASEINDSIGGSVSVGAIVLLFRILKGRFVFLVIPREFRMESLTCDGR